MLARATARAAKSRRACALGASRLRVARLLIAESLLLSALAAPRASLSPGGPRPRSKAR